MAESLKPGEGGDWRTALEFILSPTAQPTSGDSEFEDEPVDDLGDANASEAGDAERDLQHEHQKAAAQEATDKNGYRRTFFIWALWAISASIVINAAGMGLYLASQWGRLTDAVMVGWFATTIVEVLGIGYIIGNYLFDGRLLSRAKNGNDLSEKSTAE